MIMANLSREIIYFSPLHVGPHFNELNLQSLFIGKPYGLKADGGLMLNCQSDPFPINGMTPVRKPQNH
jgi:hypothetical protein